MYCELQSKKISRQQGFTMLEALLTLFVLTIGVLGVAGLQIQGMRSGSMALQRTIVVMKSQEIIERMRFNPGVDRQNLALYAAGGAANGNCNSGVVCDSQTQVSHDLFMWQQDLAAMLPSLDGTVITVVPAPKPSSPYAVTVTVNWTANDGSASPVALFYTVNVQI